MAINVFMQMRTIARNTVAASIRFDLTRKYVPQTGSIVINNSVAENMLPVVRTVNIPVINPPVIRMINQ